MFFVASRDGHLPEVMSMIHIYRKTPLPACMLTLPICLVMLMSDVKTLINYLSFSRWLFIALTTAIIPYYRYKYPHLHRPFKVPMVLPFIFILCSLFVVIVALVNNPLACGIGLVIMLLGIPVYFVGIKWRGKPRLYYKLRRLFTHFFQKITFVVVQERRTY
ncbi:cystine/glutamate transporter-like [Anneissia japonica]|uniref:cystine/glutamate transporter-like n=1 Tax=Anneissia japonica TaxID=1529436 RepID=UPI001425B1BA|nr:cystine/glutamate transporter-like [Anneissia japonica]